MTHVGRCLTARGVKPIVRYQHALKNTYLYGSFSPINGDSFIYEIEGTTSEIFHAYLVKFSEYKPEELKLIVIDNAGFHSLKQFNIPDNIKLIRIPPHTPELNPSEKIWYYIKQSYKNKVFENLDNVKTWLHQFVRNNLTTKLIKSTTVPLKSLQIETGFVREVDDNTTSFAYNSTLLRYGLLENFELRLGLKYLGEENDISSITGSSPLYLGFKVNIAEEDGWKPEIAFLAGLIMPFTANDVFTTDYVASTARFSLSHTLSDRFSLGYNFGVDWDGNTSIPAYTYSVVVGCGINDNLGMFIETFGELLENNE